MMEENNSYNQIGHSERFKKHQNLCMFFFYIFGPYFWNFKNEIQESKSVKLLPTQNWRHFHPKNVTKKSRHFDEIWPAKSRQNEEKRYLSYLLLLFSLIYRLVIIISYWNAFTIFCHKTDSNTIFRTTVVNVIKSVANGDKKCFRKKISVQYTIAW